MAAAMNDRRESRATREALSLDDSAMAVLRDSRKRIRMGSLKAARRFDVAVAAITELVEAVEQRRRALTRGEQQIALVRERAALNAVKALPRSDGHAMASHLPASDQQVLAWVERHGLDGLSLTDARAAFEDAESLIASEQGGVP